MIVIEKDIPIARVIQHRRIRSDLFYAMSSMQVGDSFEYPTNSKGGLAYKIVNNMTLIRKIFPETKFATRKTSPSTTRVWRIA